MQRTTLIALALVVSSAASAESEFLEKVESPVFEFPGTPSEIAGKAKTCMAQLVRNDEIRIKDSTAGTDFFASPGDGHSSGVTGGEVFVAEDLPGGLIVANSRIDYSSMLMKQSVQSTLTFQAKDGRFRFTNSNISRAAYSSGYMHNDGYKPVRTSWGAGHKDVEAALLEFSAKIADCIKAPAAASDW